MAWILWGEAKRGQVDHCDPTAQRQRGQANHRGCGAPRAWVNADTCGSRRASSGLRWLTNQ